MQCERSGAIPLSSAISYTFRRVAMSSPSGLSTTQSAALSFLDGAEREVEAVQRDEWLDAVDGRAVRREHGREATGRDDERIGTAPLVLDTTNDAVDRVGS